jgi:undecaprenyl-diphosphatase
MVAGQLVIAYVAVAATLIGIGLLLTHVLSPVTRWDNHINQVLASHRTTTWNDLAGAGTFLADTLGIVVAAALATLILVLVRARHWAWLLGYGLAVELAVFITANYVVARPRPSVPHVGSTPSTYSFPSGHTAATFVIYGGIALAVTHRTRSRGLLVAVWGLAVTITAWVGLSRMYEGEHHPTDVFAGLLLGLAALGAAAITVRRAERWAPSSEGATHGRGAERPPTGAVGEYL